MANRMGTPGRGKDFGWLPEQEEESLRRIYEVEDSERNFIERNLNLEDAIDFIREGVGFEVARSLEEDFEHYGEEKNSLRLLNILKRERVQTELYKAVAGLDIYATNPFSDHLRDPKNFLSSRTNRKAAGGAMKRRVENEITQARAWFKEGKSLRKLENKARLRTIDSEIKLRFGPIGPIEERKRFVAERMRPELLNILRRNWADADGIAERVRVPKFATFGGDVDRFLRDLIDNFAKSSLENLEKIRDEITFISGAQNTLHTSQAFQDLLLLKDIDNRETRKIGAASIFDKDKLNRFYNSLSKGTVKIIKQILSPAALDDLENADTRALLATIEDLYNSKGGAPLISTLKKLLRDELKNQEHKLSPFELMERLLYLEFCKKNQLKPNEFNELANSFSQLKARLRSKEAENIDIQRLANRDAAINLTKGKVRKAFHRVLAGIGSSERKTGLEPIEIGHVSAADLIGQLVKLHPEFEVFKGINKYSSLRDIRQLLYQKGKEINPVTIQKFCAMLKEAIKGFQSHKKGKEIKTIKDEWDLVGLIETLQKLETETQTRDVIEGLKNSENGESSEQYLKLLIEKREIENKTRKQLQKDLESPGAAWKIYFSKNVIKSALNDNETAKREKIIKQQTNKLDEEIKDLNEIINNSQTPEGRKLYLAEHVKAIQERINELKSGNTNLKNLKTKVEDAVEFVENNNLSKAEAKEYYETLGFDQVIDKMGTNLKMKKYLKNSSKGISKLWQGTKSFYNWSKAKFTKPAGLIARPIYKVAGLGGKIIGLAGDAVVTTLSIPTMVYRGINKKAMQRYLLTKPLDMRRKAEKFNIKIKKLEEKLANAKQKKYGVNYQRILESRIAGLMVKKMEIGKDYAKLETKAKKLDLKITPLNV